MYEQVSHSLLNAILVALKPEIVRQHDMRYFYTRLGANFYSIHSLFHHLYGGRPDFEDQIQRLVETMARQYLRRPKHLKKIDIERERDHNWFLDQQWVGMALYTGGFSTDLAGLLKRLPYLHELGINMVHVMPILDCPPGRSDGGYAVRDFRRIDERVGDLEDIHRLAASMRKRGMLLTLDVVMNHTSDEHEWAGRARAGEQAYQDYYYVFANRDMPDMFEETMPEIFPETSPGSFTFDEAMGKWVMTSFNSYQWDLNYSNPAVFIEMLDIILFWANQGADILRLDAVAFLWKKIGSTCQNEREAHLILQLMKDCCQVTAPGVLFIAEAIVAPMELTKYFGEDAVIAKECEIAYNATFMALLWDAVATKKTILLQRGLLRACRPSSTGRPGSTTSAATTTSASVSTTGTSSPAATSRPPTGGSSSTTSPETTTIHRPAAGRSGGTSGPATHGSRGRSPRSWDWRPRSNPATKRRSRMPPP